VGTVTRLQVDPPFVVSMSVELPWPAAKHTLLVGHETLTPSLSEKPLAGDWLVQVTPLFWWRR